MSHGAENDVHTLVVEHADQGTEETQGEVGHMFTVHYIVRHPETCDPEGFCPITEHIEAVGIESTLGLGWPSPQHLADGLYELSYWSQHYSGPDGDDWDAGVDVSPRPIPPGQSAKREVHTIADPLCCLHQEFPTKPDDTARCETCRASPIPPANGGNR